MQETVNKIAKSKRCGFIDIGLEYRLKLEEKSGCKWFCIKSVLKFWETGDTETIVSWNNSPGDFKSPGELGADDFSL